MKRQLLPLFVMLGGLAAVFIVVLLFSTEPAAARPAKFGLDESAMAAFAAGRRPASEAPQSDIRAHRPERGQRPDFGLSQAGYPYPVENVLLHVNYAEDWVEGNVEIEGATIVLTVTAFDDLFKGEAVVSAEGGGYFFADCDAWTLGVCPDIVPGDKVFAESHGVLAEINPVGHISGWLDETTNVVSGQLMVPGVGGSLDITCQVWGEPGSAPIAKSAAAAGGTFSCDFMSEAGWDLTWGDPVALSYNESDGDVVSNIIPWPWSRVNYAHEWAGMNYDMGHTFWITITDSGGAVKGTAEVESTSYGGWGEPGFQTEPEQWTPEQPDIAPGDWVYYAADDGYSNALQVGSVSGTLDAAADRLDGTILAPGFGVSLTVECHPWGAWDDGVDAPVKESLAEPDGSVPYSCQWGAGEWDIQPGQEVAAMYLEPDHDRVINVYDWPNITANIGPLSDGDRHVWGYGALSGGQVVVSVTNSGGAFVAGTTVTADSKGDWDTGDALPGGVLSVWNKVKVDFDNGTVDELQIYAMSGEANPDTDVITITASAQPSFKAAIELCDAASCDLFELGSFGLSGSIRVDMMATYGVNVGPDMTFHAHMTAWNDHVLIYSWDLSDPAPPELEIGKAYESSQLPGSSVTYTLQFSNVGGMASTGLVISDRLPSNVTWQSGGSYDASNQSITWAWPRLAGGQKAAVQFSGQLACGGQVVNDRYLVLSSDQEIGSPPGPEVAFDIISPTIELSFNHTTDPAVGGVTQFQAVANSDGPGPLSYTWDFDDGGTGSGSSPSHIFNDLGQYTVVLTATDPCGYAGVYENTVVVGEPTIVADFEQSDDAVPVQGSIQFTDTSSTNGPDIAAWLWDFGDGSPASGLQNPSHTYQGYGTYTVTLVVTDALGYEGRIVKANAVRTLVTEFAIGKSFESSRIAGGVVTYRLTVSDTGGLGGTGLVISDQLPSNVTWLSGGNYDASSQSITWTLPSLAAGGTAEVSFGGQLACSGLAVNDQYRVVTSDQGIGGPFGPEVAFGILPPAMSTRILHSANPAVGGETLFQAVVNTNGPGPFSYEWDFGDGTGSSESSPSHVYTTEGQFTVVLTATAPCGYQASQSATVDVNPPTITAAFDQSSNEVPIHSTVQFIDRSTTNGAAISGWLWDFGDGSPQSSQQNPSHTYDGHGTYTVTLVITDALGYGGKLVEVNAVRTLAPVFEIGKTVEENRVAGADVTYTLVVKNVGDLAGTGLVITDRLPSNVTWVSGGTVDGGVVSWTRSRLAVGRSVQMQFSGRLACSGQVVNERYRVSASDQGIVSPWGDPVSFAIAAPAIAAGFSQSASEIRPLETVFFTSTSTTNGGALTTMSWDFGDGETGSGAMVMKKFSSPGHYDVELTAADACGYQDTVNHTVFVKFVRQLPLIIKP